MQIEARPWPEIVEFYRNLVEDHGWSFEPMLELVRRVEASDYAFGLVAYTSVTTLVISQAEANFWRGPELRIDFDPSKQEFSLTYRLRLDDAGPWTRTASADEGFEVLERFLVKRARWFRKSGSVEQTFPSPSSA